MDNSNRSLVVRGSACAVVVDYQSEPGVPIYLYRNAGGELLEVIVADGAPFDDENTTEWSQYADQHDLYMAIAFHDPVPARPQSVTALEDSLLGARGVGVISFAENGGGELVAIDDLDLDERTLSLHFTLPVIGHNSDYPPTPGGMVACDDSEVTGTLTGSYQEVAVP